jgi:hypothetical protein
MKWMFFVSISATYLVVLIEIKPTCERDIDVNEQWLRLEGDLDVLALKAAGNALLNNKRDE